MLIKMKNKKAMNVTDIGMLVYRVIFLALTTFVFIMFLNLLLSPPSFSERAKVEMLFSRVHYSAALHYTNPNTQTLQTNVIDLQKLIELENNGLLEQYFKEQFFHPDREDLLVFRLNIKFTDYSLNPPDDVEKEFISNSEQYFLLYPKRDFEGKGAVTAAHRKFSTQCFVNDGIIPCSVDLLILSPNS